MKSLALIVAALSLTACPRRVDIDQEAAEIGVDSTESTSDEGALLSSMLDGAESTGALAITAEQAAAGMASRVAGRYAPAGCVTVEQTGAHLAYTFDNCVGPRGLRAVDGVVEVDVSIDGEAIVAAASATDFHIGLATIEIAATGTYTNTNGTQALAVVTHTTGVGGRGFALEHDGDYTVSWDDDCVTLEGAWSSSRGDLARSTTADVTRCRATCPTGSVTRTTVRDNVIEIVFDGTATASWSSARGRSGTFALDCP